MSKSMNLSNNVNNQVEQVLQSMAQQQNKNNRMSLWGIDSGIQSVTSASVANSCIGKDELIERNACNNNAAIMQQSQQRMNIKTEEQWQNEMSNCNNLQHQQIQQLPPTSSTTQPNQMQTGMQQSTPNTNQYVSGASSSGYHGQSYYTMDQSNNGRFAGQNVQQQEAQSHQHLVQQSTPMMSQQQTVQMTMHDSQSMPPTHISSPFEMHPNSMDSTISMQMTQLPPSNNNYTPVMHQAVQHPAQHSPGQLSQQCRSGQAQPSMATPAPLINQMPSHLSSASGQSSTHQQQHSSTVQAQSLQFQNVAYSSQSQMPNTNQSRSIVYHHSQQQQQQQHHQQVSHSTQQHQQQIDVRYNESTAMIHHSQLAMPHPNVSMNSGHSSMMNSSHSIMTTTTGSMATSNQGPNQHFNTMPNTMNAPPSSTYNQYVTGGMNTSGRHNGNGDLADACEDSKMACRAIPEVIKLLSDENHLVVYKAVLMVHQLSKKEASRKAITESLPLMQSIARIMTESDEQETLKCCSAIFHDLSQSRPGLQAIYRCNGIYGLVRLLDSPVESILFYSMTTLHNLLLHLDGSKHAVRSSGAIEKMVRLLDRDEFKFLAIVADCLQILAYCNQEGKLIILQHNGPAALVRILNTKSYEKLLWTVTRVLKVLSVCSANKHAIVAAGGMQALAMHLNHPTSTRLVLNCLWTLRNLSDAATGQTNLAPLLQNLVCLLASDDINIITCVAGILSNLTCNNQTNKQTVYQVNGIPALVQTLVKANDRQEIVEPTLLTLRHLTCRHPHAEHCQNQIRLHYGLPHIIRLLHPPSKWPVIKAVIGLIRNLALSSANHQPLGEQNVIQRLYQLLSKACQEIKRTNSNYAAIGTNEMTASITDSSITTGNSALGGPYADGIHMNEIIEGAMGSLHLLAEDPANRELILGLDLISICVELLFSSIESICKAAIGCLDELANHGHGAQRIELEGGCAPLSNLMNSSSKSIAATAASVLFKINQHKQSNVNNMAQQQQQQQRMPMDTLYCDDNANMWDSVGSINNDLDLALMIADDAGFSNAFYNDSPTSVMSNNNTATTSNATMIIPNPNNTMQNTINNSNSPNICNPMMMNNAEMDCTVSASPMLPPYGDGLALGDNGSCANMPVSCQSAGPIMSNVHLFENTQPQSELFSPQMMDTIGSIESPMGTGVLMDTGHLQPLPPIQTVQKTPSSHLRAQSQLHSDHPSMVIMPQQMPTNAPSQHLQTTKTSLQPTSSSVSSSASSSTSVSASSTSSSNPSAYTSGPTTFVANHSTHQ